MTEVTDHLLVHTQVFIDHAKLFELYIQQIVQLFYFEIFGTMRWNLIIVCNMEDLFEDEKPVSGECFILSNCNQDLRIETNTFVFWEEYDIQ